MLLRLQGVTRVYRPGPGAIRALDGVDLNVGRGEFVSIMGPSGSGKSTLLNILGCLHRPTAGRYLFDGESVDRLADPQAAEIRNRKIGFVFQAFHLLPKLTALRNVELPLVYRGVPAGQRLTMAGDALARLGLQERQRHLPAELSGGEQQRVAIARALVADPALILADEPTGNLDSESGRRIMTILSELHRSGRTVVMVTHENECARITERVVRLRDGKIVADEPVC